MRYRSKLINKITSEKNREQSCLTVFNMKLDDVFNDVFILEGIDIRII